MVNPELKKYSGQGSIITDYVHDGQAVPGSMTFSLYDEALVRALYASEPSDDLQSALTDINGKILDFLRTHQTQMP
ncbi:hypothetical protein [Gluconobacter morbifer]|nr:hypothetical protein [Gluconobacter morbifer]